MSGDVAVRFYGVVGMVVGKGRRPGRSYECARNGKLKATGRIGWYRSTSVTAFANWHWVQITTLYLLTQTYGQMFAILSLCWFGWRQY